MKSIVDRVGQLVMAGASKELAKELEGAQTQFAADLDEEGRVIAMAELLRVVSTTEGGQAESILAAAGPFAEQVLAHSPKVPVRPPLLQAQLLAFFEILDQTTFTGPGAGKLRESRVRELITIWDRAERTWSSYADLNPEALASGEAEAPVIDLPPSLQGKVIPGAAAAAVKDPKLRREYEEYLAKKQELNQRIIDAFAVADLRKRYLRQVRTYLARVYSNKPAESGELQRILSEVIHDKPREQSFLESIKGAPK